MRLPFPQAVALVALLAFPPADVRANCSSHPADVAPGILGDEMPTPSWTVLGDGAVDVQDVLALLNAAVNNIEMAWTPPVDPGCVTPPGNVSPGSQDDGFSPPRWTPDPDMAVDVGDVLVGLRLAVSLIVLDPAWLEPIVADGEVSDRVVAGSVIDSITATGLPAVVVTARFEDVPVGETNTDAEGKFLLQGLPSGLLTLRLDGSGSTAGGKFSTLEVEIVVDTEATTSVQPITLADETDPDGATGKFTGDETGTVNESIELSSDDGDVGLETGPGGKIEIDGEPADGEVDLSVVPIDGEDLPDDLTDDGQNSTGEVAVGPADGKFTEGGSGLSLAAVGGARGFDLILPNRDGLPIGTAVDIWHWDGTAWANCTAATGRGGVVFAVSESMTAVRADGVATEGGLYAATLPLDPTCTSTLSGRVVDGSGAPLAAVFVTTSLGASGFTDAFGAFFIRNVPAYTGLGPLACVAQGYEVLVRGGVELGSARTSTTVSDIDVIFGFNTFVGDLTLSVPNEGCLSGLVLANGVGQPGPVTITGPDSGVLTADDEGRFFQAGMTPGSYRASFLFPGESIAREFDFEIVARECTTIRLALNEGSGSERLIVEVRYDFDDELPTPNPLAEGALVRLIGSDAGSAQGLTAVTGPSGRVIFEGVSPPYDIVAIIERPMGLEAGLVPIMRIGSGLVTPAPLGFASLLLRLPGTVEFEDPPAPGDVMGVISNLPTIGEGEHVEVAPLRPFFFDAPWGGGVDPATGSYFSPGYLTPFDLAVVIRGDGFPSPVRELAFFGPFQVPPPISEGFPPQLMQDLDYATGDRLVFDQSVTLAYSNMVTSVNPKDWSVSGGRMDGRSFFVLGGFVEPGTPFPTTMSVPSPGSTGIHLFLEFASEPFFDGLDGQFCIVPLSDRLPASQVVDFLLPPEVTGPAGPSVSLDQMVTGSIEFDAFANVSGHGFNGVIYETLFPEAGPGELGVASFRRWLPADLTGDGALGATPQPFIFEGTDLLVGVVSYRGDGFPLSHVDLFGPDMEETLEGLPLQAVPACLSVTSTLYSVSTP